MSAKEDRERKERIRHMVLEQVPVDSEIDEEQLLGIIDESIEKAGGDGYIRFGESKRLRREIYN